MDEAGFVRSELVQDAVIRNLEIIGEASRNIETRCPAFAAQHPDLPLSFAWQMRNVLAHGYFKVDLALIWQTVQRDLPALRQGVQAALDAGAATPTPSPTHSGRPGGAPLAVPHAPFLGPTHTYCQGSYLPAPVHHALETYTPTSTWASAALMRPGHARCRARSAAPASPPPGQ